MLDDVHVTVHPTVDDGTMSALFAPVAGRLGDAPALAVQETIGGFGELDEPAYAYLFPDRAQGAKHRFRSRTSPALGASRFPFLRTRPSWSSTAPQARKTAWSQLSSARRDRGRRSSATAAPTTLTPFRPGAARGSFSPTPSTPSCSITSHCSAIPPLQRATPTLTMGLRTAASAWGCTASPPSALSRMS